MWTVWANKIVIVPLQWNVYKYVFALMHEFFCAEKYAMPWQKYIPRPPQYFWPTSVCLLFAHKSDVVSAQTNRKLGREKRAAANMKLGLSVEHCLKDL